MTISVIIPIFCDTKAIPELLTRLFKTIDNHTVQVILVEDGTQCDSWSELIRLKANWKSKSITLMKLKRNVGQHYALWIGMHEATGDKIITMDADLQHPPEAIPILLTQLDDGSNELIYGSASKGHPKLKQLSGLVFRFLTHPLGNKKAIQTTGFRAFNSSLLKRIIDKNTYFASLDPLLQHYARGVAFSTVPHHPRRHETSNYNTIARWKLALHFLLHNSKSYRHLLALGSLATLGGLVLSWPAPTVASITFTLSSSCLTLAFYLDSRHAMYNCYHLTDTIDQVLR